MPEQPKPEESNLVDKIIAWEREQKTKGIKLGPTIEDYVNEMAQAVKDSEERRKKMTRQELIAQLTRNARGKPS